MSIDNYLNLITSQHKVQPKFTAWLSAALSKVDDGMTATNQIPSSFDIDNASGVQLDTLGVIVGRSRVLNYDPSGGSSPILDDTNYRIALKAKIARNQWDGTIPQVYDIWDSLFPDVRLTVIDNQNMTMNALADGPLSSIAIEMIASGLIIPKPTGVGLTIIAVTNVNEASYIGMLVTAIDTITVSTNIP